MAAPTLISTSTARHYSWGDRCDGWHLVAEPGVSVIEERMPPGTTELRHHHERAAQFFYVLAGRATITVGQSTSVTCSVGEAQPVGPRAGIFIAPGVVHVVANEGPDTLEFLVISVPPSHGDRVNG